jgi:ABC-type branched-subunit amino acid transport system substrate-binding protein
MVSQTASSDSLTSRSPYFFRVNPSDSEQGTIGAKYAEQTLHAKNVALFVDNSDPYSQSLATAFSNQFQNDGNKIVVTENYTVGTSGHAALPGLLRDAESKNPDLIYFAGYASDAGILLANLPTTGPYAHLAVMGGDALYELGGYPPSAGAGFNRLRFTSFAYPDEWDVQHLTASKPAFFNDYSAAYNPRNQHTPGTYGYTRADGDVILSYDAMQALLHASNLAMTSNKQISGTNLQQALLHLNGSNAFQGVSGQIALGSDGNAINKAVLILYVDPNGHFRMDSVQGCFLVGKCS